MAYLSNIDFDISKFGSDNKKGIGAFVSYSRLELDLFNEVIDYFNENKINVLSDKLLDADTSDFYEEINEMIYRSTCAIFVGSHTSAWTMFELGRLKSLGKTIYVYKGKFNTMLYDAIYIDDLHELSELVKKNSLFSDLLEAETKDVTIEKFNNIMMPKLGYMKLKISIPGIKKFNKSSFRFSYIIPHFCRETIYEKKSLCYRTGEDLEDAFCKCYDKYNKCPYVCKCEKLTEEIMVLNKTYNAISVNDTDVTYLIPVNNEYGVTFKCYVDILDEMIKEEFIKILINAGIVETDMSGAGVSDRVYFTLPARPQKGLFKIKEKEGFENNYICPGGIQ